MEMKETLELLEGRIKKAVVLIDRLSGENKILNDENGRLKIELAELKAKLSDSESRDMVMTDTVRTKLGNIMTRLSVLEKI